MRAIHPSTNVVMRKKHLSSAVFALREYAKVCPTLPLPNEAFNPWDVFREYGIDLEPHIDDDLYELYITYPDAVDTVKWDAFFAAVGPFLNGTLRYVEEDESSLEFWGYRFRFDRQAIPERSHMNWMRRPYFRYIDPQYEFRLLQHAVARKRIIHVRVYDVAHFRDVEERAMFSDEFLQYYKELFTRVPMAARVWVCEIPDPLLSQHPDSCWKWDVYRALGEDGKMKVQALTLTAPAESFVGAGIPREVHSGSNWPREKWEELITEVATVLGAPPPPLPWDSDPKVEVPEGAVGLTDPEGAEDLGAREGSTPQE